MMQNAISWVAVVATCATVSAASAGELVLADNGQSAYKIVLAENASPSTRHGAEELQMFLKQMTEASVPIVSDRQPPGPKEIILGDNAHLQNLGVGIDFAALGNEGYVIRTVGEHLVIAGGQLRGNMYGVYGFLEDHLGCRWFAPGVNRIPKRSRLAVGPIDDRQVPRLEYRESYLYESFDGDWCARNRLNSCSARLDEKHGGKVRFAEGFSVHTFERLMPPEKYFKDHPEYFSLVNGKRKDGYAQLCCTNEDVIRICTEVIREAMRSQPNATVFSVSQNDCDKHCDKHCECSKCQALAEQEESQMAPVLQLVNRVAEAVEKEFPDKIVETLAYTWTQRPPKRLRPRPNVVIRLCSFECCFSHPLATCDSAANRAFRADLENWSKATPRLWVWDYATDFYHFLLPFPNHRALGQNIRFFAAHNVKGVFEQDIANTADTELGTLGGYIVAKCLWNPNYDPNAAMDEFLEGYYDKAAAPIRTYIDMLHDHVDHNNVHVTIYVDTDHPHLTDELLTKADKLWQQAEELVAAKPEVLRRVKRSRMSVDYAILERARLQAQKKLPANDSFRRLAAARFRPFGDVLQSSNLTQMSETDRGPLDKKAYLQNLAQDLGIAIGP